MSDADTAAYFRNRAMDDRAAGFEWRAREFDRMAETLDPA